VVEVVAYEERPHSHSQFFIGPLDALGPAVSLAEHSLEDLPELDPLLLVVVDHVRRQRHDQAPEDVIVDDSGIGGLSVVSSTRGWVHLLSVSARIRPISMK
jgi:hypothetical protein